MDQKTTKLRGMVLDVSTEKVWSRVSIIIEGLLLHMSKTLCGESILFVHIVKKSDSQSGLRNNLATGAQ